jgi:hypothetical protein
VKPNMSATDCLLPRIKAKIKEMESAGLGTAKDALFLRKMEGRCLKNTLSDTQRDMIMNIMGRPLPKIDDELFIRLQALIHHGQINGGSKDILISFREQVSKRQSLSPKQMQVINGIEDRTLERLMVPNSQELKWINWAVEITRNASFGWGDKNGERIKRITSEYQAEKTIYRNDFVFLCKVYGSLFKEAENFNIPVGKPAIRHRVVNYQMVKTPCLVMGKPEILKPMFVVEVLDHNANVVRVPINELKKP